VSFWYDPDYFERLAADVGVRAGDRRFTVPRLPALRALSPLAARAAASLLRGAEAPWEELTVTLAADAVRLASGVSRSARGLPLNAEARLARVIRTIDRYPAANLTLGRLAREAGLSAYHFLRTFKQVVGVTPHQYLLRARLREAATRVATRRATVLDVALDCGFGDVSNFNRAFRAEFGQSPLAFRRSTR
jgi:AraC family transcriptional regulator